MPRLLPRRRKQTTTGRLGDVVLSARTAAWLGRHMGRQGRLELQWRLARTRRRLR